MRAHVKLTARDEDLMRISADNPGWQFERDHDGALVVTPPTGAETSRRNVWLTRMIDDWAKAHCYVAFDSNCGFSLPDGSVIAPDASLVTQQAWEQLTPKQRERFFPGAPAVAIELCSYTDNPKELQAKLEHIRQAGASYVVLIDPYRKTIWSNGALPSGFDVDFKKVLE